MRRITWLSCELVLAAAVMFGAGHAGAEEVAYVSTSSGGVGLVDSAKSADGAQQPPLPTKQVKGGGITWNVTYGDVVGNLDIGFDDPVEGAARQATVEAVLEYIGNVLNEIATIDVYFEASETSGVTLLGFGPNAYLAPVPIGFHNGMLFDHITTGVDPSTFFPDVWPTIDFGYPYQSDHTQLPAAGQYDLYSVFLHQMTHSLGIQSLSTDDGNSPFNGNPGTYLTWEQLLRSGTDPIWDPTTTELEPGFTPATLTSDNIFFSGANAAAAHGSNPPVYAPNLFQPFVSLSHFKAGSVDSIMVEPIPMGVALRQYTAVDIGALRDIGFTNAAAVQSNVSVTSVSGVGFVEEGDTLVLSATFSGLVNPVVYQWKKNGANLTDGGRFSGATTNTLTIASVQNSDSGAYVLTGNDASKALFSSGPLSIQVVPAGSLPAAGLAAIAVLMGLLLAGGLIVAPRRRLVV